MEAAIARYQSIIAFDTHPFPEQYGDMAMYSATKKRGLAQFSRNNM
jgi:hypothetical protein